MSLFFHSGGSRHLDQRAKEKERQNDHSHGGAGCQGREREEVNFTAVSRKSTTKWFHSEMECQRGGFISPSVCLRLQLIPALTQCEKWWSLCKGRFLSLMGVSPSLGQRNETKRNNVLSSSLPFLILGGSKVSSFSL